MLTITSNAKAVSATPLLKPLLLTALRLVFPAQREQIRVSNPGQRCSRRKGPLGHSLPPEEYGEEYILNCPFCGDVRGRMRIAYTYDPGDSTHHWYCFNEGCQKNPAHRADLANRLQAVWLTAKQQLASGHVPPALLLGTLEGEDSTPVFPQLPEGFVSLGELPHDHWARSYVTARQFDPDFLSHHFGVGYSENSRGPSPAIRNRIVIPFYRLLSDGTGFELLGWQARSLEQDPIFPKYMTMAGMRKSKLIYTAPSGITPSDRLIVAEGVTDVWRLGGDAVGILGKKASPHQLKLLVEAAQPRRRVLVALDSDAETEATALIQQLQAAMKSAGLSIPVVRCRPRAQNDFGACNAYETEQAIAEAMAMAANMPVPHARCSRRSVLNDKNANAPRNRKELAERMVVHATPVSHHQPIDAEARVAELGMTPLLDFIEVPLLPIISDMERVELRVDLKRLGELAAGNPKLQTRANSLIGSLSPETGRIHTTMDQLGTRTGRITTRKFNLQNLDRPLRSAIVADEGRQLVCADFSQFEWRLAAVVSRDERLLSWCADSSIDLYREVACLVLKTRREGVTARARELFKNLMMKFLYSSKNYEPNDDELWWCLVNLFPGLVDWRQRHVAQAIPTGIVRTPMGRIIAIDTNGTPDQLFNRAVNYLIQGAAADVFKSSCLSVRGQLPPEARLLLPHHDSILLDAPQDIVTNVICSLGTAMQVPIPGCPIIFPCKIRSGTNWGEVTGC